jgi:hypothetical protein
MRAIVLYVVSVVALIASPALAQQTPATPPASSPPPADAPVSTAAPPPPFQAQPQPQSIPAPDSAQIPQAIDPLADLIAQSAQSTDEDEAEAAPSKPAPRHKGTILPIPPPETLAGPDGAPSKAQVYELRVKGSIAAAQSLQGPLDGAWRVTGADGTQLYALQLVDKAGGLGELEGAWRDVRRPGTVGSTGLIEELRREGDDIIVRFSPRGGQSSVLTLRSSGYERWTGQLAENGAAIAVVAEHILPQAPPGYEGQGRGPYVWPPRVAPSRPTADAAPACSTRGKKGKALKAAKAKCAAAARKGKASTLKKGKGAKAKAVTGKRGKATVKKGSSKKKRR